ncbi:MAG: hypothetical protein N3B16_00025, partial [Candidatus Aminicenantes bacterium]|nr:hypothetical protein [Candidatus Aminicenantes bacterium]
YRFLLTPPIHISPHNSEIIYIGAQVLLRSLNRGDHWQEISPDLTSNDQSKIIPRSEGGLPWFAISTIAESPLTPGLIWVGTCDGRVWLTKNSGATWIDLTPKLLAAGGHKDRYISRISPSHFKDSVAYLCQTGYWQDDFAPLVFKTEDYGNSWISLATSLPQAPINVIFEDRKNQNLLFLGNDEGLYVSIDGGRKWLRWPDFPKVPVKDLLVHPKENDLVVATFGRGLYVTDIHPLQEISERILEEEIYLFSVEPKAQRVGRSFGANDYLFGDRHLVTPNEPNGLIIYYYLKNKIEGKINIVVTDLFGQEIARLVGPNNPGINSIVWEMRPRFRSGAQGPRNLLERLVEPGEYIIILEANGKKFSQKAKITKTIGWSIGANPQRIR